MDSENKEEGVLKILKEKENENIKFVRIVFPDILGRMLDFTIPSSDLKSAFKDGKGIDGSSIEGFARIEESDLLIFPQAETFRILPWEYGDSDKWREAIIFGNIYTTKRELFPGDTRYLLKRTLEKTVSQGRMLVGPELEFFLFSSPNNQEILDNGSYFHGGSHGDLRKEMQLYLGKLEIECEFDHHEVAPSQHEIDLKYKDALTIADSIMLARYVIKRVANKHGIYASFMPKPIADINGSGMHLHISLWDKKGNLFFNREKQIEPISPLSEEPTSLWSSAESPEETLSVLSDSARKYIAGLIKYGPEIQIALNQCINSYKRLTPGFEAPVYLAWGQKNRSAYIRVPQYGEGKQEATRIEIRNPDPACNPYFALTMIHLAGIQGINENLDFMPSIEKNIFEMNEKERKERGIKSLSQNLYEALELFKSSSLVKQKLPKHLYGKIIENKEKEWQDFSRAVTDYEKINALA